MTERKPVAIYARYSTDNVTSEQVRRQLWSSADVLKALRVTVTKTYKDRPHRNPAAAADEDGGLA